jgi:hypothetical protein
MKNFYAVLLVSLLVGCSKHTNNPVSQKLQGIWVEKTLRLDTIDFNTPKSIFGDSTVFFNSKGYWDYSVSTTYPVITSAIYDYYISKDSIYLHNYLSSCWKCYAKYWFKINNNQTNFQIGKFYRRSSLSDILEFEKIK